MTSVLEDSTNKGEVWQRAALRSVLVVATVMSDGGVNRKAWARSVDVIKSYARHAGASSRCGSVGGVYNISHETRCWCYTGVNNYRLLAARWTDIKAPLHTVAAAELQARGIVINSFSDPLTAKQLAPDAARLTTCARNVVAAGLTVVRYYETHQDEDVDGALRAQILSVCGRAVAWPVVISSMSDWFAAHNLIPKLQAGPAGHLISLRRSNEELPCCVFGDGYSLAVLFGDAGVVRALLELTSDAAAVSAESYASDLLAAVHAAGDQRGRSMSNTGRPLLEYATAQGLDMAVVQRAIVDMFSQCVVHFLPIKGLTVHVDQDVAEPGERKYPRLPAAHALQELNEGEAQDAIEKYVRDHAAGASAVVPLKAHACFRDVDWEYNYAVVLERWLRTTPRTYGIVQVHPAHILASTGHPLVVDLLQNDDNDVSPVSLSFESCLG